MICTTLPYVRTLPLGNGPFLGGAITHLGKSNQDRITPARSF